jgi:uncharacterized protein (TIGR03067 family)
MRRSVALLLFAAAVTAAPVPKKADKTPPLDGRWECLELNANDSDVTAGNPWVWDIDGEKLTIWRKVGGDLKPNEANMTTTLVRPKDGGPNEIDYFRDNGNGRTLFKGLVALDGDNLTVCYATGGDRPTELKADKAVHFVRFKRAVK